MALTARERSRLALTAYTALLPEEAVELVRTVAADTRAGISLLGSGPVNLGARIGFRPTGAGRGELWVDGELPLCTFAAVATATPDGRTRLRVGGLLRYEVLRPKVYGTIPAAPEVIAGYDVYTGYLRRLADAITRRDPGAETTIGTC